MDVVSGLEHTFEVELDNLRTAAPPPLARMVDHLMALADDGHPGAAAAHGGSPIPPTSDRELAQGEAAMAMGLSGFEAAERLRGLVDAAQFGALTRLHASAQAVFDSAAAQSWVGRTPFTVHEMVVLEVTAATGLGAGEAGSRLDLAIGSVARFGFLRDAVAAGLTTLRRACRLVEATRQLGDEATDTVVRAALAPTRDGSGLSDSLFAQRMRRTILAVDAERVATRAAARKRIGAHAQIFDAAPAHSPSPTMLRRSLPPSTGPIVRPAPPAPKATRERSTSCGPTSSRMPPSSGGSTAVAPSGRSGANPSDRCGSSCRSARCSATTTRPVSCPGTAGSAPAMPVRSPRPRSRPGRRCSLTSTPVAPSPSPARGTVRRRR